MFSIANVSRIIYHAILRSISDPFCIIDRDYRVLWMNRDMPEPAPVGSICFDIFQQKREPCPDCPVRAVVESGQPCVMEKRVPLRDGSTVWGEIRAYPVYNADGEVEYVLKIGHDVTAEKLQRESQRQYVRGLEERLDALAGRNPAPGRGGEGKVPAGLFSNRELEVLLLLAEGHTNMEISGKLAISHHTVKTHVVSIFNKLGVNDRTQAAVWAARLGLI